MRFVLDHELFGRNGTDLALLGLFDICRRRLHRITVDQQHRPAMDQWLSGVNAQVARDCRELVVTSEKEEALRRSAFRARVGNVTDLVRSPPWLSIADAAALAEGPFRLFVEGPHVDRAFLQSMMTPAEKDHFADRVRRGLVDTRHCGGIDQIGSAVSSVASAPGASWQCFAMFDSDGLSPTSKSASAAAASSACEMSNVKHHCLERRMIENYLPIPALKAWASTAKRKQERKEKLDRVHAFEQLKPVQRHHFNLKKGFDGDRKRLQYDATAKRDASALYADLSASLSEILAHGFGNTIAGLFEGQVTEHQLRSDGCWQLMRPIIHELMSMVQ